MSDLINMGAGHSNEQIFYFDGIPFTTIRKEDGTFWFIGKEVATILGYSNTNDAILRHCKRGRETRLPTNSGYQSCIIIPQGDLFRLIVKSKMPKAQEFETLVFDEIIPSVVNTGTYTVNKPIGLPSHSEALRLYADALDKIEVITIENNEMAPKAHAYDNAFTYEDLIDIKTASDWIGIGKNTLLNFLREWKWSCYSTKLNVASAYGLKMDYTFTHYGKEKTYGYNTFQERHLCMKKRGVERAIIKLKKLGVI